MSEQYIVLEHEVGKLFDAPDDAATVVKACGRFERGTVQYVLVMWAVPQRLTPQ